MIVASSLYAGTTMEIFTILDQSYRSLVSFTFTRLSGPLKVLSIFEVIFMFCAYYFKRIILDYTLCKHPICLKKINVNFPQIIFNGLMSSNFYTSAF